MSIDKRRPLAVGDRVRIYGHRFFCDGEVVTVMSGEGVGPEIQVADAAGSCKGWAHPKQCRRLVKKQRREWWIVESSSGCLWPYDSKSKAEDIAAKTAANSIIHVREVKP